MIRFMFLATYLPTTSLTRLPLPGVRGGALEARRALSHALPCMRCTRTARVDIGYAQPEGCPGVTDMSACNLTHGLVVMYCMCCTFVLQSVHLPRGSTYRREVRLALGLVIRAPTSPPAPKLPRTRALSVMIG